MKAELIQESLTSGRRLFYAVAVGVCSVLTAFLVVVTLVPRLLIGEGSEAFFFTWLLFGGPVLIAASGLSAALAGRFAASATAALSTLFFVGNVLSVAALSLAVPTLALVL